MSYLEWSRAVDAPAPDTPTVSDPAIGVPMKIWRYLRWVIYVPATLLSMLCGAGCILAGLLLAYAIVVGGPVVFWEWLTQ